MKEDKIIEQALSLPPEERVRLRRELSRLIDVDVAQKSGLDLDALFADIQDIVGVSVFEPRRTPQATLARMLAGYYLSLRGVRLKQTAAILRRHHATIIYYIRSMDTALTIPRAYRDWVAAWKELLKRHPL